MEFSRVPEFSSHLDYDGQIYWIYLNFWYYIQMKVLRWMIVVRNNLKKMQKIVIFPNSVSVISLSVTMEFSAIVFFAAQNYVYKQSRYCGLQGWAWEFDEIRLQLQHTSFCRQQKIVYKCRKSMKFSFFLEANTLLGLLRKSKSDSLFVSTLPTVLVLFWGFV